MPNRNIKTVELHQTSDQLSDIFRSFDKNGDKRLSRDEIKEAFNYLHSHFPGWTAFWGLKYADANKDGYIDENELKELVSFASKFGYTLK